MLKTTRISIWKCRIMEDMLGFFRIKNKPTPKNVHWNLLNHLYKTRLSHGFFVLLKICLSLRNLIKIKHDSVYDRFWKKPFATSIQENYSRNKIAKQQKPGPQRKDPGAIPGKGIDFAHSNRQITHPWKS